MRMRSASLVLGWAVMATVPAAADQLFAGIVPHQVACEAGPAVTNTSCVTGGNWIATYYPSAVCTTSGACAP
jgi:hypothetical protein